MSGVTVTDARSRLSALVDEVNRKHEPVHLTRRGRRVAAIVDAQQIR
ncbi:type II toxin-antitoxin system Phd/YefM family antitoxin [Sinomonas gamaensis]|nr:type II toxin-antitoxin system Phd/YefM family antitoxin [Sinomonas gamaensis]